MALTPEQILAVELDTPQHTDLVIRARFNNPEIQDLTPLMTAALELGSPDLVETLLCYHQGKPCQVDVKPYQVLFAQKLKLLKTLGAAPVKTIEMADQRDSQTIIQSVLNQSGQLANGLAHTVLTVNGLHIDGLEVLFQHDRSGRYAQVVNMANLTTIDPVLHCKLTNRYCWLLELTAKLQAFNMAK